ncbi:hypothetical protein CEXT_709001 [Caerostris extrusa]|uniref:Uncharacterized protein n=1 Tax=Caerostris extrusa TaxID=172846 RepID=A0AAV4NJZ6_CAEEX|nr:hypothetical protein CEXT_709001 [Caerostris extrusa]
MTIEFREGREGKKYACRAAESKECVMENYLPAQDSARNSLLNPNTHEISCEKSWPSQANTPAADRQFSPDQ